MLLTGLDLHCAGPLALKEVLQHLPAKMKPKKVLLSERWGSGTVPFDKYSAGYCITFTKSLDEGLR